MMVVATKRDATTNRDHLEELRAFAAKRGLEFHAISSASGEGIPQLVRAMADALDRLAPRELPDDASHHDSADSAEAGENDSHTVARHGDAPPEEN